MKRFSRIAVLTFSVLIVLAVMAIPALGTEETTTTVAEEPAVTSDVEPAVPVTTPEASETPLDWTYRYLIPTGIVIAVLVVVITTVQYFTSVVRKRYRIVKE